MKERLTCLQVPKNQRLARHLAKGNIPENEYADDFLRPNFAA